MRGSWAWLALWVLISAYFIGTFSLLLLAYGYADVLAGILALAMAASGVWSSAKGMARLKRSDSLSDTQLEASYRYRNAGIALALTGSGLLVLSWETFLGRFISP